jgi:hypothetical protein
VEDLPRVNYQRYRDIQTNVGSYLP